MNTGDPLPLINRLEMCIPVIRDAGDAFIATTLNDAIAELTEKAQISVIPVEKSTFFSYCPIDGLQFWSSEKDARDTAIAALFHASTTKPTEPFRLLDSDIKTISWGVVNQQATQDQYGNWKLAPAQFI